MVCEDDRQLEENKIHMIKRLDEMTGEQLENFIDYLYDIIYID